MRENRRKVWFHERLNIKNWFYISLGRDFGGSSMVGWNLVFSQGYWLKNALLYI